MMNCLPPPTCNIAAPVKVCYKYVCQRFYSRTQKLDAISDYVCNRFLINRDELYAKLKTDRLVEARQAAIFLATKWEVAKLGVIGNYMGGRDHTTIIHNRDKVFELLDTNDPAVAWLPAVAAAGFEGIL